MDYFVTDDLRDRIAAAIAKAQFAFNEGDPYNGPEDADVLADSVITALNFHDRIAAAVNRHYGLQFCQCGWKYDPKTDDSYADHVADAVIAELGADDE